MNSSLESKKPSIDSAQYHTEDDSDTPQDDRPKDAEDGYTEETDTGYSLFSNPTDLAAMRQKLFDVDDPFEMSVTQFDMYFPFVDNVWRKTRSLEPQTENVSEMYCCRLKSSGQPKSTTPKPPVEGKQQRRKRKREDKTCSMMIKVTYLNGPEKKVRISKAVQESHTHDLEYMDQNKRNTAIMNVAREEATRGFLPGSIFWKMQDEPEKMEAAGGKFMKVSDVRNVQYPWRQQNMSASLKAHAGYSQQRSGPRQRPLASAPSTPSNGYIKPQKPVQTYSPVPRPALTAPIPGTLMYPDHAQEFLRPYLPYPQHLQRPHITLTWATSLDSRIALAPGTQTQLSGPETKAMTHYLRSRHDAILIGVNTAISDDPGLNCRLGGAGGYGGPGVAMQPRPIIIDPRARLEITPGMRLLKAAAEGKAKGPWIVVGPTARLPPDAVATLKNHGGEFLQINEMQQSGLDWQHLFNILYREGIKSIMIEGGGKVLSELLKPKYTNMIDSIIMTIAPTFLGRNGVQVTPDTSYDGHVPVQSRLIDVHWQPMGTSDMVLCGHLNKTTPRLPGIEHLAQQSRQTQQPNHQPPQSYQPQQQHHHLQQSPAPVAPPASNYGHHPPQHSPAPSAQHVPGQAPYHQQPPQYGQQPVANAPTGNQHAPYPPPRGPPSTPQTESRPTPSQQRYSDHPPQQHQLNNHQPTPQYQANKHTPYQGSQASPTHTHFAQQPQYSHPRQSSHSQPYGPLPANQIPPYARSQSQAPNPVHSSHQQPSHHQSQSPGLHSVHQSPHHHSEPPKYPQILPPISQPQPLPKLSNGNLPPPQHLDPIGPDT